MVERPGALGFGGLTWCGSNLGGIPIYPSLTAMIAAGGIDAVTITTPPQTRRDLVLEAIDAGLHVVADKPFGS